MKSANPVIIKITTLLLFLIIGNTEITHAQSEKNFLENHALTEEITKLDSAFFAAFNHRDLQKFQSFLSEDLEFYHDQGGLTDYTHALQFLKEVTAHDNGLKREVLKESIQVYPIPGYGALQIGAHTFCHRENNKQDCGTFQFVQIWQKKNNEWKITRIISYGH